MQFRKSLIGSIGIVIVLVLVGILIILPFLRTSPSFTITERYPISGRVLVFKNGKLVAYTENLVVNGGLELVELLLRTTYNTSMVSCIAVATDMPSPSATWTSIPNEITTGGLARANGTITDLGTGNWRVEVTYTATASFTNVNGTGIYWQLTGNNLFAAAGFTGVNLVSGDQLTVRWEFTVS